MNIELNPKFIVDLVNKECRRVIANISKTYGIDYDELNHQYMPDKIHLNNMIIKRKGKKHIPVDELCMARKTDLQQCTRRKLKESDYCTAHNKKLVMGRIDEPCPINRIKYKNRRKANVIKVQHTDLLSTYLGVINRQKFLIDSYNRVYYYNSANPEDTCYIGIYNLEGSIDYDENYLKDYYHNYPIDLSIGLEESNLKDEPELIESLKIDSSPILKEEHP